MRHGPMVHRSANTSRLTQGATAALARLHSTRGLAPLQLSKDRRAPAGNGEVLELQRLNLLGMLPINLRHFLANHLGPMLRIEGDSIFALAPQSGERAIRELARAIRRFSAERSRELWRECTIRLSRLAAELVQLPADQRHVVLCLRCASIAVGLDAATRHRETSCFAIELNRALAYGGSGLTGSVRALVADGLRRSVEDFRRSRSRSGLPHFDLDCYVTNDQMIFTWRPLPPLSHAEAAPPASAANGSRPCRARGESLPDRQTE